MFRPAEKLWTEKSLKPLHQLVFSDRQNLDLKETFLRMSFFSQYHENVNSGPEFVASLPQVDSASLLPDIKIVAYYLPQYHQCGHNDRFWGEGFTEWTNVTKAIPRFCGHYQPRLPGSLGFYDLATLATLKRQTELARQAGIHAFCFHHYWFSGQKVLRKPLDNFLSEKSLDLRFCLNWANENWTRKWDGREEDVLLRQDYKRDDIRGLACDLSPYICDDRYLRIDGKPMLMIYRPNHIPNAEKFIDLLRRAIEIESQETPFIVCPLLEANAALPSCIDGTAGFAPHAINCGLENLRRYCRVYDGDYLGTVVSYDGLARAGQGHKQSVDFPSVCPGWDNEARRSANGYTLVGSTPSKYGAWLHSVGRSLANRPAERRLLFVNAWNEWAEGAYLEPDRKFGYAYLTQTQEVLQLLARGEQYTKCSEISDVNLSQWNVIGEGVRRVQRRTKREFDKRFGRK